MNGKRGGIGRALARLVIGILFVVATGLAGCKASLEPARELPAAAPTLVRQIVFPSGLRVVAERDATSPVVGIFLVVGAGSSKDPVGKEGLAHLVEHLAFRSRPFGRSSLRRLLERAYAADWNAQTTMDATLYSELGPASALEELLRLEGARMLAPVANVTPDAFALELHAVRGELAARNETGFSGDVLASLQRAVFPAGHPYARPSLGTEASLGSIQESDIASFIRAHYQPGNMTLAILGDIDLATIDRTLEGALPAELLHAPSSVHRMPIPAQASEPPAPPAPRLSHAIAPAAHPELWVAWSLPRAVDANVHLARMVADGAGMHFYANEDDIASMSSRLVPGAEASMLVLRVELRRGENLDKTLDRVLEMAKDGGGEDDDVFRRRKELALGQLFEGEDLVRRGKERALTTHFTQSPTTYGNGIDTLVRLEQGAFLGYVRKYLAPERARAVYVPAAPDGGIAAARPIGKYAVGDEDFGPLPIDEARLRELAPGLGASAYRRMSLPNGLDVIIGRHGGLPRVAVHFLLRGGYATAAQPATAYSALVLAFFAHPPSDESEVRPRGQVALDKTYFAFEGPAGRVGPMLAGMGHQVRDAKIDPRVRMALDGRRERESSELIEHRRFMRSLLAATNAHGLWPTDDELATSTHKAAQDWLDAVQVPNNGTLIVIGDMDPTEVERLVRTEFGGWASGSKTASVVPPGSRRGGLQVVASEETSARQSQVRLGCILPLATKASDLPRRDVVARLVEARLAEVVAAKSNALTDVVATAHVLRGGTSYLDVSTAVERDKLATTLAAMKEALRNLAEGPLDVNALAWAKLRAARARTLAYGTNGQVASAVMEVANLGFPLESLDLAARYIAETTAKDVQDDVRACMTEGF
ncbi:insulinase family protein [Pendulispora brunnea]|uniref:Insulinase family protein n=1 Tax=Pendulispora brunnea TaxID=2905690 RepID=A0ABZ2KH98_9BACT